MKKLLCMMMAIVASLSVMAFATACEDGKCDKCKTDGGLLNEVTVDEDGELCAKCRLEDALA